MNVTRQATENRVYGMAASTSILAIFVYWMLGLLVPLRAAAILFLKIRRRMMSPTDTKLLSAKDAPKNEPVVLKPNGTAG
jgi:hypothetical protein